MIDPRPRHLLLALAFALALPPVLASAARAAGLDFMASVDRTTVGLGDQFQLTLTVQGEDMSSVPKPTLPPLPDLDVLGSSSSQSTSISIVNGRMKRQASIEYVYALSAKKLGKIEIPSCTLNYKGTEYRSQPIEITVVDAARGRAAPATPGPGASAPDVQGPAEGDLFIRAVAGRRTVYVGEPVMLEVSLATRVQMSGGGWASMPSFGGFWTEPVFDADKFDFKRATIGGVLYNVSLLKKVALFPISSGNATIAPMAFNAAVVQPSRDPFGFFGTTRNVRLETKPITIKVLPLPEQGKPEDFLGGVGRFTLSAALDRTSSDGNEPVNLTVKIAGTGNVRLIEKPRIPAIPGLRILDPEIKDAVHVAGDRVEGTKTLRYPILPQTDGKYVIAPIRMSYFDPAGKTYRTLETEQLEFSASGVSQNAPLVEATGLKVLGTDINYIKSDATALAVTPFASPRWPGLLYLLSLGVVGGAVWYRGHSQRLLSDRGYARKVRSSGLVKRRLRQAEGFLKKRDDRGFYAALAQAVIGYLGDRFNMDTHAMTRDQLRAALDRLEVVPETSAAVLEVIEQCEVARFSPDLLATRDPRQLLQKARDVLGRV